MIRERVEAVVATGNRLYARSDEAPQTTMARLPGRHGAFSHEWNVLTLDLESVHDPEKFWHVYNETIPHEWAHKLNDSLNGARGHGDAFEQLFDALRAGLGPARDAGGRY